MLKIRYPNYLPPANLVGNPIYERQRLPLFLVFVPRFLGGSLGRPPEDRPVLDTEGYHSQGYDKLIVLSV